MIQDTISLLDSIKDIINLKVNNKTYSKTKTQISAFVIATRIVFATRILSKSSVFVQLDLCQACSETTLLVFSRLDSFDLFDHLIVYVFFPIEFLTCLSNVVPLF